MKSNGYCACGFYLYEALTWSQANTACKSKGGRLPEIVSAIENEDVFKFKVNNKTEFLPNEDPFKFEVSNILKLKTGINLISAQTLVIVAKSVFSHL